MTQWIDNNNPQNWSDTYPRIAIFRVHQSIYEVRKCPICSRIIDIFHEEALNEDRNRNIVSFEMR